MAAPFRKILDQPMYRTYRRLCHSIPFQSQTLKGRRAPWHPVFRLLSLVNWRYVHLLGQGLWPITTDLCLYSTTQSRHAHVNSFPEWRSNPRSRFQTIEHSKLPQDCWTYTTSAVGTASSDSRVINLFLTMRPDYLDTFSSSFTRACWAGWLRP
jgi:hypothetical protein